MRHRLSGRKLNRTSAHRRALCQNLARSLFEHEQIKTTLAKAKEVRRFAEKLITLAKRASQGELAARQRIVRELGDRAIIGAEHRQEYESMSEARRGKVLRARSGRRHRRGEPKPGLAFTAESVVHRLINTIAPRFEDRPGGYTRIIKLARNRVGDNGQQAILQLVGSEASQGQARASGRPARRRRAAGRVRAARAVEPARRSARQAEQSGAAESGQSDGQSAGPQAETADRSD
ncbi:MAG: 50S ribosomal protein L17 [Phycisphaerae bacterium]